MGELLNLGGRLMDVSECRVMGILNVTPDSFYGVSRETEERGIASRVNAIIEEGGDIIDIGGCSTRPGSEPVSESEEIRRLRKGLSIARRERPDAVLSVDTFRRDVARMAVEEYGAEIINDVSEGADPGMFGMVARLGVAYILTSQKGDIGTMLRCFAEETDELRGLGVKDIILDPGFGFGKDVDQNYAVLSGMEKLGVFGMPVLVGVSRKRMVYELLGGDADRALNGTTVLNVLALIKGAGILRVHDVREAREACIIYKKYKTSLLS